MDYRQSLAGGRGINTREKQRSISDIVMKELGRREREVTPKAKIKRVLRLVPSANGGKRSNKVRTEITPIKFDNMKSLLTALSVQLRMKTTLLMTEDSKGKEDVKLKSIQRLTLLRCLIKEPGVG